MVQLILGKIEAFFIFLVMGLKSSFPIFAGAILWKSDEFLAAKIRPDTRTGIRDRSIDAKTARKMP